MKDHRAYDLVIVKYLLKIYLGGGKRERERDMNWARFKLDLGLPHE